MVEEEEEHIILESELNLVLRLCLLLISTKHVICALIELLVAL